MKVLTDYEKRTPLYRIHICTLIYQLFGSSLTHFIFQYIAKKWKVKSTDQRKTFISVKNEQNSILNWRWDHRHKIDQWSTWCSATIHSMLFNTSIIINLVYFIQYKFTFHMLKHPKLWGFFLAKIYPKCYLFMTLS
jgi:hypothetical protein